MCKMKKISAGILALLMLVSCGSKDNRPVEDQGSIEVSQSEEQSSDVEAEAKDFLVKFTDALDQEINLTHKPEKVAVVMGSFAEVWSLAGGDLAAVTQDVVADGKVELSQDVVLLGDLKSPSVEQMVKSEIDFVVLSANIVEHVSLKEQLANVGITSAYFDVEVFQDYLDMLRIMCDITQRDDLYKTNGTDIKIQIDNAIDKQTEDKPTVLFLRAFSSGIKAKGSDSMTGAMLKDLGCINIADSDAGLLDDLSMESIIQQDPDYIFVVTMGESSEKAMAVVEEMLISNPAWSSLSAIKNDNYNILQKELFHLKPNNRWGESYEILAEILYN